MALLAALLPAAMLLAACTVTERDAARVDCGTPGPHGVDCTVARTAGENPFEACWDLAITCENGGVMSAAACQAVGEGEQEVIHNMPVASFADVQACDVPSSGAVLNLGVTSQ